MPGVNARRLNSDVNANYSGEPQECPVCHFKQVPIPFADRMARSGEDATLLRFKQCTNSACEEVFISRYAQEQPSHFEYA